MTSQTIRRGTTTLNNLRSSSRTLSHCALRGREKPSNAIKTEKKHVINDSFPGKHLLLKTKELAKRSKQKDGPNLTPSKSMFIVFLLDKI